MAEFRSNSLAEQVFHKLENDIILGVYPRGEILTELKLVEQLGVSRTPIREALRRLELERLIEDTGKGSVVLGITEEDLLDIMNIRQHIEGLASYYAAMNITEEGKKELQHIMDLQEFYASRRDVDHLRHKDDEFHKAIYKHSGRSVICDTLIPLHRKTQRYRRASIEEEARVNRMVQEHRAICDAILSGDGELASQLTTKHIENAKIKMMERMRQNG